MIVVLFVVAAALGTTTRWAVSGRWGEYLVLGV